MTEVDPQVLTSSQWDDVTSALVYMWIFVFVLSSAAGNLLIAHAVIPSLYMTGHVGPRINRVRLGFYGLTVVFAIATIWTLVQIIDTTEVLRIVYPKVWI